MFVCCKHLKVIVMAIVKVIVMARTMRGETLSKGLRELHYRHSGDKGDTAHVQKGSSWVKGQGITPGHKEPLLPEAFTSRPIVAEGCVYIWGRVPG